MSSQQDSSTLFVEPHSEDYAGEPYLTVIKFRKQHLLAIVDNVTPTTVSAYILDLCDNAAIEQGVLLNHANNWFNSTPCIPFSVYLAQQQVSHLYTAVYKSLNIEYVSRIIGPAPTFALVSSNLPVKRRRIKPFTSPEATGEVSNSQT